MGAPVWQRQTAGAANQAGASQWQLGQLLAGIGSSDNLARCIRRVKKQNMLPSPICSSSSSFSSSFLLSHIYALSLNLHHGRSCAQSSS